MKKKAYCGEFCSASNLTPHAGAQTRPSDKIFHWFDDELLDIGTKVEKNPGWRAKQMYFSHGFFLWAFVLCVSGCFVVWRAVLCSFTPAIYLCHPLILIVLTVLKLYSQFPSTCIYPKQEKPVGVGSGDQSLSSICWTMSFFCSHWWASCLWWVTDSPERLWDTFSIICK